MPLMASVGTMRRDFNASNKRQKPTRMPYSCQAQLGKSGCIACPIGGDNTMRGIGRSWPQCSTFTITHTNMRPPSGTVSLGRSTIAEYGTRWLGS